MKNYDIAVIGGDKRTSCMALVFAKRGYKVICYGTCKTSIDDNIYHASTLKEAVFKAPTIICGIPFEKQGNLFFEEEIPNIPLTELQRHLRKHHKIFGGVIPAEFSHICEKRKIECYDFMQEEPLSIYNAIATAEGAILEALLHKPTQLHQSNTLVLGYGRCGRVLAHKLAGLSAQVTVCSSQPTELANAVSLGLPALPLSALPWEISKFEYLFNTIPATVLPKNCLLEMNPDSLVIDIASNRIGVDYEAATLLERNVLFCPGLPGKYAALSCAEQLVKFVLQKQEKGNLL